MRGAYQICRWSIGDDYVVEGYLYWFGPTAERERLEDAQAWQYALDEVSFEDAGAPAGRRHRRAGAGPRRRPAGRRDRRPGLGRRGGLGRAVDHGRRVRARPRRTPAEPERPQLSGPLPPEDQVVDLLGAIAEQLSAR